MTQRPQGRTRALRYGRQGSTRNGSLLFGVPAGVTTPIVPVVAPDGTEA